MDRFRCLARKTRLPVLFAFLVLLAFPKLRDLRAALEIADAYRREVATRGPAFRTEVIVSGLEVPWDFEFMPDGRMLILERPGRLRVLRNGTLDPQPLQIVPEACAIGVGGLLDLVLHPEYSKNGWVYVSFTSCNLFASTKDREYRIAVGDLGMNLTVVRFRDTGGEFVERKLIYECKPVSGGPQPGGRMAFGPDGKLYLTTGAMTVAERAQDLGSPYGKTLRLNDDGTAPADNPFIGVAGALPEIFSLGHRNALALDFQQGTGLMFQAENGPTGMDRPKGFDEVNIVEAGKNYGWPIIWGAWSRPGLESPLYHSEESTAPGGACFYTGNQFPGWKGNLFIANLVGKKLQRLILDGRKLVRVETVLMDRPQPSGPVQRVLFPLLLPGRDFGRLRAVKEGPDGYLYVSTSNASNGHCVDLIFRLVPAVRKGIPW